MQLPSTWAIPDTIRDRFGQRSPGEQRAMLAEGHLVLILHKVPQSGDRQRVGAFFWRRPDGRWEAGKGGVGIQLLNKHIKEYSIAEEKLNHSYQAAKISEDYFEILETITPLQRATKNLYATLQAAREAVPDDRDIIDLRDWAGEIERSLDLLYQNTKNALEFEIAKKSEEQTRLSLASVRATHRLNLLAAIFFPLTAISCAFGMNLTNGLEGRSANLFWFVLLLGIVSGFIVRNWVLTGSWSNLSNSEKK
ncbi:MAG: CorA family divalent cation transporter [Microcoleaceae cyanobacterium]